jgi:hypothetical protein
MNAAIAANAAFKKAGTACFGVNTVDAADTVFGHKLAYHNWVEISCRTSKPHTPGSYVTVDPWPTGGDQVEDASESSKSWDWLLPIRVLEP